MVIVDAHSGDIHFLQNGQLGFVEGCGNGGNGKVGTYKYCTDDRLPEIRISDRSTLYMQNSRIVVFDNKNDASKLGKTKVNLRCFACRWDTLILIQWH